MMENVESNLYLKFEELVGEILKKNEFSIESYQNDVDFVGHMRNYTIIVEVKLYRRKLPKLDLLKLACRKLQSNIRNAENVKPILIVSSYVTPSLKEEMLKESGVIVWDVKTLFALSYDFAELYYELESVLTNAYGEQLGDLILPDEGNRNALIDELLKVHTNVQPKVIQSIGEKLCNELNGLRPGNTDATKFENKCIEILKYLFDNETDLTLWEKQPTTDDRLHRFDLLCRIISSYQNTFWTTLSSDFHTRYVLFEFKNYTGEIPQSQIYSTEKYLFLTALRSVSFIIARNGAHENAIIAAKGALKEAGKLIVILTNEDICKMLKLKDDGDEPAQIIQMKIDELLVSLTR